MNPREIFVNMRAGLIQVSRGIIYCSFHINAALNLFGSVASQCVCYLFTKKTRPLGRPRRMWLVNV